MSTFTLPHGHPLNPGTYPVIPSRYDDEVAELLALSSRGPATRGALLDFLGGQSLITGKQPKSTMLTKLAALADTLTEGQLIKWNATLGEPVAVNPGGTSLNAQAVNATGVTTPFTTTAAVVPSTAISVTDSASRPVVLEFEADFVQTTVGAGTVWLSLYETTSGAVHKKSVKRALPGVTGANGQISMGMGLFPLGAVTTTRTFELRAILFIASGTPTASIGNGGTAPTVLQAINL